MTIQFVLAWASAQYQLNSKKKYEDASAFISTVLQIIFISTFRASSSAPKNGFH